MAVTLKQIAELAGVSRGTVDRALYNRGRVKPEVAERIKKIAKELGYQPNRAGKALAMTNHPMKIGVIAQATETPFMHQLRAGIEDAANDVAAFGAEVIIRSGVGLDVTDQLKMIDELLAEGINGLAIAPADNPHMRDRINSLVDAVEARQETIENIAQAIIDAQPGFFEKGLKGLKPLTMQEIAEKVGVHHTTVSRTVNDKFASTPKGTVELRKFFTQGFVTETGEQVAKDAVEERIKEIISGEDKKNPLSDDKISQLLKGDGLTVARRTVAKYRLRLDIPGATERRVKD